MPNNYYHPLKRLLRRFTRKTKPPSLTDFQRITVFVAMSDRMQRRLQGEAIEESIADMLLRLGIRKEA